MANAKNVIVITSDELRGDCVAYAGNPDVQTPHLDAFAKTGAVFKNHFTIFPKCVPARVAMMTGRYCHTDGFRNIFQHLPNDQPNVVGILKERGYETAVFGINHVWENFFGDNTKSSGYIDYHSFTQDYFDHINERKWEPADYDGVKREPVVGKIGYAYTDKITDAHTGHCDDNRAEQAIHYLKEVRDRSKPFYMQLNISKPHPGYDCQDPYFSMYDRDTIQTFPHDIPKNAPLPFQKMREIRTGFDEDPACFRDIQATYYGMISRVDNQIGRVLQCIEEQGLYEDTVVIFTADHGDFAGQYGLFEKWDTVMHDCLLHVPMIVRTPDMNSGSEVVSLSEHVDVGPTILDALGLEPDWGVHGESMLPMIRGERMKQIVFAEGGHEEAMQARFNGNIETKGNGRKQCKQITYHDHPQTMSRTKMARTDDYKLVIRLTGGNEFYDLRNDPHELDNKYGDPAYMEIVNELQLELINWCIRTDTDRPFQEKVGA